MKYSYPFCSMRIMLLCAVFVSALFSSCRKMDEDILTHADKMSSVTGSTKPNIIFILEDEIGYEIPQFTGGQSYSTPVMNSLAAGGMQFTHCYAGAMCSPTRITLLTGKYGFRNYHNWGILDTTQKTIANILKDHGYVTCVSGKWQLDGGDNAIRKFGFDKYSVFDPFDELPRSNDSIENKYRYKNPKIYEKGAYLPDSATAGKYSDDMFADYAAKFIRQNKAKPFFIYFSFSECHEPYSPPPSNPLFASWDPLTMSSSYKYFPDMVSYMDSKISVLINAVNEQGLQNNTFFFIMGDNGSPAGMVSKYKGRKIVGAKGTTNEFGLHVSLVVKGPGIQMGAINKNIVDCSDFLSTIANIAAIPQTEMSQYGITDGVSFYNQLFNVNSLHRTSSYGYYFPFPSTPSKKRVYVQDTTYKLYDSTNHNYFFNMQKDSLELHPIPINQLTLAERQTKKRFSGILSRMH